MSKPEFHMISNGTLPLEAFAAIAGQVCKWVSAVHLREKQRSAKEICNGMDYLCNRGVPNQKIYINDRADIAWCLQARGVHLAYHSLEPWIVKQEFPNLRIGRSVHDLEEAKAMEQQGVDYLFFGHIFPSASKPGKEEQGLVKLAEVSRNVAIPVIAIGGIRPENVKSIIDAGAGGIAVISGLLEASDPTLMATQYAKALYGEVWTNEQLL